jgi:hypothetical protein
LVALYLELGDPSLQISLSELHLSELDGHLVDALLRIRHIVPALSDENAPLHGLELLAQSLQL